MSWQVWTLPMRKSLQVRLALRVAELGSISQLTVNLSDIYCQWCCVGEMADVISREDGHDGGGSRGGWGTG